MHIKRKGYRVERKIRKLFENKKWRVVRAGASLGEADLVCLKGGKTLLLQIKSTNKEKFYYYDFNKKELEGHPFYLVVDFGYGKIRILEPQKIVVKGDGMHINDFLEKEVL